MRPGVRAVARAVRPAVRLRNSANRLTVLGWHSVDASGDGLATRTDVFAAQLGALASWDAVVLPLEEAVCLLAQRRLPPRAVVLTFDDGYASVLEIAWPMLRERGLPATLFVVSGYLDGTRRFRWDGERAHHDATRLADRDQVAAAAAEGLDIGSHAVTHRWLPHLDAADVESELTESRAALRDLLGREVESFAYPMGGWNPEIRQAARRAGYRIAVGTERGRNGPGQDPLSLRRSIAPDSAEDFRLLLDGAYTWLRSIDSWRERRGPPY